METGKQRKTIDAGPVDAWTIAFSPDSRLIASGTHTGKLNLFGVESGKNETTLDTRGKFTLSIAYVSARVPYFIFVANSAASVFDGSFFSFFFVCAIVELWSVF